VLSWAHNLRWAERAQEQGFDEVVLLNEFGRVAECTSANVFAVFGNDVITPPLTAGCLPGITREVLLEELHSPGIRLIERDLAIEDLYLADEVFITSTTRGLLRVREIARRPLAAGGDVCARLFQGFDAFVAKDIGQRKSAPVAA
jgi:branched-chain amino acid aminotransferase